MVPYSSGFRLADRVFRRTYLTIQCETSNRPRPITRDNATEFINDFDTFILDCDGVLWNVDHERRFEGVTSTLKKLRQKGKRLLFASNNSIPSSSQFVKKITAMTGYECSISDMFGVNRVLVHYLKQQNLDNELVYAMASEGTINELEAHGVRCFGFGPDNSAASYRPEDLISLTLENNVKAVLVGQDQYFNYMKLAKAASYLKNPDVYFIATSWETGCEFSPGRVQPIVGSLAQCVSACAGRAPIYMGKPEPLMFEIIKKEIPGINRTRTCMIGDNLKSDIAFAKRTGIASLVVFTGVTSFKSITQFSHDDGENHFGMPLSSLLPDYYINSITDLAGFLD